MPARGRTRGRGFTLLELCLVVAIMGLLAALGFQALGAIRERDALSLAPKQFMAALETARTQALATGRETVLVVVGSRGPADARECWGSSADPARCVRYWVLEDVVDGASGRFDDAALTHFEPGRPTSLGDRLLGADALPNGIYLGRHPGYLPPPVDPASAIFARLPLEEDCSFCTPGTPPRGYVRFRPDGAVQLGNVAPGEVGGTVFFSVARSGAPLPDTRVIAILQPAGLITDRLVR